MRLTTKGRFAVTAMIDLGLRQNSGPVTLAAISQRQQISLSYLEQLFGASWQEWFDGRYGACYFLIFLKLFSFDFGSGC